MAAGPRHARRDRRRAPAGARRSPEWGRAPGSARFGGAQRRGGDAAREQVGRRQVAAQVIEDVRQPVRPVADAVAVEIGLAVVGPVVAVERGCRCACPTATAASGCRRTRCPRRGWRRSSRRSPAPCPTSPRRCARNWLRYEPSRKMPRALSAIRLSSATTSSHAFSSRPDRGEAAVVHEPVAPERHAVRVHQRRAGGAALEHVVLEHVVVREHVVQAVAEVAGAVAAHQRRATTTGCRSRRGCRRWCCRRGGSAGCSRRGCRCPSRRERGRECR